MVPTGLFIPVMSVKYGMPVSDMSLPVASSERLSNQQPAHNQQPGRVLYLIIPR